jgi:hypothetical protein
MSYEEQIQIISKLIGKNESTLKRIGKSPKGLSKFIYIAEVLPIIDKFMITDKADGTRGIIEFSGTLAKCLVGSEYFEIKDIKGPSAIVDCEVLMDKKTVLIYDILSYNQEKLLDISFNERYKKLTELATINHPTWKFAIKKFWNLTVATYATNIMGLYNAMKKYAYKTDGIIFTYIEKPYLQTFHYKWKPPEHLTIDFLVINHGGKTQLWSGISRRVFKQIGLSLPDNYKQMADKWVKISSSGDIFNEFFPVPFSPSIAPSIYFAKIVGIPKGTDVSNQIVEVSWDTKASSWIFHRIRTDRVVELADGHYFGNNFEIAELTYESIVNPLTIKDLVAPLTTLTKGFYFEKTDQGYRAARGFNNYVKTQLMARNSGSENVIDMASGKGQDLGRYLNAKIKNLLMLEIDQSAIDELITRKYDIAKQLWIERIDSPIKIGTPSQSTNIIVSQMDLNQSYNANINKIHNLTDIFKTKQVDLIVCNMALHYLMVDQKHITNVVNFIAYWLKNGGEFMFTALDGEKIKTLLSKGPWETELYKISYSSNSNKPSKNIKVLLPCSREPREEPLIDINALDKEFNKHKIIRIETKSFGEYLTKYEKNDLSNDDKQFVSLYHYCIYKKIN